jgi:hypothetical protein
MNMGFLGKEAKEDLMVASTRRILKQGCPEGSMSDQRETR